MDDHGPIILDLDGAEELATEAVRARLARHEAYLHAIDEGLEAAEEGRTSSDEDVQARFHSMRNRYLDDRKH